MLGRYLDGPYGQLHLRVWNERGNGRPLLCLPPSPFSSAAYTTIAPLLAKTPSLISSPVIALDYPGYGNSSACPHAPLINDYAQAAAAVCNHYHFQGGVDLLGFHTGCLVAVEASLLFSNLVNRLILIDSPYFNPEKQAELLLSMGKPVELAPELAMLESAWDFCVSKRLEHIPLDRAYDMFVDHIRTGVATNAAFKAAFQYPCKDKFNAVTHPTHVIATQAGLHRPSINTANDITNAKLIELSEVSTAVLEYGAPRVTQAVNNILLS